MWNLTWPAANAQSSLFRLPRSICEMYEWIKLLLKRDKNSRFYEWPVAMVVLCHHNSKSAFVKFYDEWEQRCKQLWHDKKKRRWWGSLSPPELSAWGHFINVSGRIPKRNKLVGARLQQKPVANFSLSRHKHPETADKIQLVVMWKRLGSWTEPRDTKTFCVKLRGVLLIKRYLRIHNLLTCRSVCR